METNSSVMTAPEKSSGNTKEFFDRLYEGEIFLYNEWEDCVIRAKMNPETGRLDFWYRCREGAPRQVGYDTSLINDALYGEDRREISRESYEAF